MISDLLHDRDTASFLITGLALVILGSLAGAKQAWDAYTKDRKQQQRAQIQRRRAQAWTPEEGDLYYRAKELRPR